MLTDPFESQPIIYQHTLTNNNNINNNITQTSSAFGGVGVGGDGSFALGFGFDVGEMDFVIQNGLQKAQKSKKEFDNVSIHSVRSTSSSVASFLKTVGLDGNGGFCSDLDEDEDFEFDELDDEVEAGEEVGLEVPLDFGGGHEEVLEEIVGNEGGKSEALEVAELVFPTFQLHVSASALVLETLGEVENAAVEAINNKNNKININGGNTKNEEVAKEEEEENDGAIVVEVVEPVQPLDLGLGVDASAVFGTIPPHMPIIPTNNTNTNTHYQQQQPQQQHHEFVAPAAPNNIHASALTATTSTTSTGGSGLFSGLRTKKNKPTPTLDTSKVHPNTNSNNTKFTSSFFKSPKSASINGPTSATSQSNGGGFAFFFGTTGGGTGSSGGSSGTASAFMGAPSGKLSAVLEDENNEDKMQISTPRATTYNSNNVNLHQHHHHHHHHHHHYNFHFPRSRRASKDSSSGTNTEDVSMTPASATTPTAKMSPFGFGAGNKWSLFGVGDKSPMALRFLPMASPKGGESSPKSPWGFVNGGFGASIGGTGKSR
jgi:hypothetical protein